jgi:23S rRNA pseudouridine1911/1915/1917 synthase
MRVPITVIHEDNHLIAVIKPAGMLVHGDETGDTPLIDHVKGYIKDRYSKPGDVFLGTIHRLDRPVSGVVIFARTSKALSRMNELLRKREIKKTYHAIVTGRFPEFTGTLHHHIIKESKSNFVRAFTRSKKGTKPATTEYAVEGELHGFTKVRLHPLTGRSHQLRVQCAKVECPIVGDLKYGSKHKTNDYSICLHCSSMEFIHPVKKESVKIECELPKTQYWDHFM